MSGGKQSESSSNSSSSNNNNNNSNGKSNTNNNNNAEPEDKYKKFENEGVIHKAKLIGSELVMEPRGDKMCQNSIQRLKAIIKGQKAHKRRIVMKISYSGVKVYDEKSNELLYSHEVPQISFIAGDDTDSRTFGYVCDVPNKTHQFICFKTAGPAIQIMTVISSLFEAVSEKRKEAPPGTPTKVVNQIGENTERAPVKSSASIELIDQLSGGFDLESSPQVAATATAAGPLGFKEQPTQQLKHQQQEPLANVNKQTSLDETIPFNGSPLDLFGGGGVAGDSGIVDSPSALSDIWLNETSSTSSPQVATPLAPLLPPPVTTGPLVVDNQPQQQQPQLNRPKLLDLNLSSSSVSLAARPNTRLATPSVEMNIAGNQNRSLIYNHSSVSLNDAALTRQSSFNTPLGQHNESTDKYAVFNDIDNLPSIFESTSSLGSTTKLSNVGLSPADGANTSHFSQVSTSNNNSQHVQSRNYIQMPAMMAANMSQNVPIRQPAVEFGRPLHASGARGGGVGANDMIVGSAPMAGHQMAAHARFSSSMATAGLHQRLNSSASGFSRQTNPFDDDFFA